MGEPRISGFTVARNVEFLGYPFIESVRSALPVCDEFIISEGFSTDRTWEAVQALAEKYPEKIRVRRDQWTVDPDDGEVIAKVSNLALGDCRGEHCLYLQGNEVLHEDSLEAISTFPRRFRSRTLFSLPFHNLLGKDLLWLSQARNRFFRRCDSVCVTGDGYDVGYRRIKSPIQRRLIRTRKNWFQLIERIGGAGKYDHSLFPAAVFRYRALFPGNYLRKVEVRRNMAREGRYRTLWDEEIEAANLAAGQCGEDPVLFWNLMVPFFERCAARNDSLDPRPPELRGLRRLGDEEVQPAIMRDIGEGWFFDFDQSLERLSRADSRS